MACGLITGLITATLAQTADSNLRLLETTDLHMNLLSHGDHQDKPTTECGLARTITLIKAARFEVKSSLLFDNGDLLQGSPMGDWVARVKPLPVGRIHPAYKVLNAIGVDDGDGNPANDGRAFTPWVILERRVTDEAGTSHTLKIGVLGFVPPQMLVWDRQHLEGRLTVRDIQETARRLVPQVRTAGADLIVLIPHAGFEWGETPRFAETSVARLAEVPGVDAILFGHSKANFRAAFSRPTRGWTSPAAPSTACRR